MWTWDQQEPFGTNPADENPSGLGAFDLPLRLPGQYFDKETNTHYNMARDYSPDIGRYIQSDPIGLEGGLNSYAYVSSNPLSRVDKLGLVDWSGSFVGGTVGRGIAAGFYRFNLTSECVDGLRGRASGWAVGVGFGIGVNASFTISAQDFKDFESTPNPKVFEGNFLYAVAGVAYCKKYMGCSGVSYTGILHLGDAYAEAGFNTQLGFDFGANIIGGRSIVTKGSVEPCCN